MSFRGCIVASGRLFAVYGNSLNEIDADGVVSSRGTLSTSEGRVGMAWGTTQLVITDGAYGYTLTLGSNTFATISDADYPGSVMVSYLDGWFIYAAFDKQQFYVTSIDNGGAIDALDFASAQSVPDTIVAHTVVNRELLLAGENSTEWWYAAGGADFPLERRTVAAIGCIAPWTLKRADNAAYMLGRDENGAGMVYVISGYQAKRISNSAIEYELSKSTDLAAAEAYTWQWRGETFYAINAPGLDTTFVYQISTGTWFEMADLDEVGDFMPWRGRDHAYCYGQHYAFSANGKVWRMDAELHTFGDDPRVWERTSPHNVLPMRDRQRFSEFVANLTTGRTPIGVEANAELSWSNDGGYTFSDPVIRSLGAIGEYSPRVVWRRVGMARDRVWRLRGSAAAPMMLISAEAR